MMGKIRRALPGSTPTLIGDGCLFPGNIIGIKQNIGNTMHSHISSSNDFRLIERKIGDECIM